MYWFSVNWNFGEHWSDAAVAFARAVEIAPDEAYLWRFRAVALVAATRLDEYREVCAAMMDSRPSRGRAPEQIPAELDVDTSREVAVRDRAMADFDVRHGQLASANAIGPILHGPRRGG